MLMPTKYEFDLLPQFMTWNCMTKAFYKEYGVRKDISLGRD